VPQRERIQDRPRTKRRDEGIDLRDFDEHAVDQAGGARARDHNQAGEWPRHVVFHLQADREDMPHDDPEADGEVDASRHHRHHRRKREERDDRLVAQNRSCIDGGRKRVGKQNREERNQQQGENRQPVHGQHPNDRLASTERGEVGARRFERVRFQ
jgi:hypothetical protein